MLPNRNTAITWLGHASFLVETPGGKRLVIDPFFTGNPAYPQDFPPIDHCDLILLTHAHGDHIGDAIPLAQKTGAPVVAIVELAAWLASKGVTTTKPMNKGGTQIFDNIAVTMVNAFHSSSIQDGEQTLYGGEAAGFVVTLENDFTFYHAGDTCLFGDMALIGEVYQPELAMLPIGDHYTMGPKEAAKAVRLLGVRHVLPMHYGTFPLLTGTPSQLRDLTAVYPTVTVHELKPGETLR